MFSFESIKPENIETNVGRGSYKKWEQDWKRLLDAELQCETEKFSCFTSVVFFFCFFFFNSAQSCSTGESRLNEEWKSVRFNLLIFPILITYYNLSLRAEFSQCLCVMLNA